MRAWAVPVWALALALLALGPALGAGFVLTYDMVFVPGPTFSWSQLGVGEDLPRAVPLDAVTTALTVLVPSWLLQKAALLGVLVAAGTGAAALVPSLPLLARLTAATVAVWNPYVAERLVLGHWGLLLAYGALPWLVLAVRRGVTGAAPGGAAPAVALLAVCALTPTGGLLALVVVVAIGASRAPGAGRRLGLLLAAWLLLNATWWLPGLLHSSDAVADGDSVAAFAARAELPGGVLPTLLGLGGVWNSDVVPDSRETPIAVVALVLVLALAGAGVRTLVRQDRRLALGLGSMAAAGLVLALLGALPGTRELLEWAVTAVPGAGLLRDGQKFVALLVPLLAALTACGAARLAQIVPDAVSSRVVLCGVPVLLVALLPDLAWGAGGRLDAVRYPAGWADVRARVAAEEAPGDLLLLPWGAFRAYEWNGGRTVLDPGRRFFPVEALGDDRLVVGSVVLAPENPRAVAVGQHLAGAGLDAADLRRLGIRLVLAQTDQPGAPRPVPGTEEVVRRPGLRLARVPGEVVAPDSSRTGGTAGRTAVVAVDLAAAGLAVAAAAVAVIGVRRRRRRFHTEDGARGYA